MLLLVFLGFCSLSFVWYSEQNTTFRELHLLPWDR